jgi:hypothetical protein
MIFKKPNDIVAVYTARGEMHAQVIKGLLDANGIPSLLQSNAVGSVYPFISDGMGEYKIMVAQAMAEEARRIIEAKADA